MQAFIEALQAHAPHPSPFSRPLRVCTRGEHPFQYVLMGSGGPEVPVVLETGDEVDALMRERAAVEL
jgi:hypothetical protein